MRRFVFLISAVALTFALVFFPGCGGDDDNPAGGNGGGNDTLTTEQVLGTIETMADGLQVIAQECDAIYVLNAFTVNILQNSKALELLGVVMQTATDSAGDISAYYGTWQATGVGLQDSMKLISAQPSSAVKVKVIGADTTGASVPGDITIHQLLIAEDSDTIRVDIAVHADGSSDSLSFLVYGSLDLESGLGSLTLTGSSCDVSFLVTLTMGGASEDVNVDGWFQAASNPRMYFKVDAEIADLENMTGSLHLWTQAADDAGYTYDLVVNMTSDMDSCITGMYTVKKNGNTVGDMVILVENCDAEEPDVYVIIDGVTHDAEELFEELFEAVEGFDLDQILGILEIFSMT